MINTRVAKHHNLLVVISFLAFISLGLPDGLLGAAWPSISHQLNISLDSLGILLIGFVTGYLSTSITSGKILTKISLGLLLTCSCILTGLSLFIFAFSNFWWLTIIASFFLGAGGGAIDTSINTFAASKFSASVVNWLHAFYGIGATLGPFIITMMLTNGKQWYHSYLLVGFIQLFLAAIFLLTIKYWKISSSEEDISPKVSNTSALKKPLVWVSIILFFLYTGLEIGVGQWIYTLLTQSRSIAVEQAGFWTGIYWGSLTVGRIIFGFVLTKVKVHHVVVGALTGVVMGTLLLLSNQHTFITLAGIIVIGFSNAPVFPCLISMTPARVGKKHAASIIGFQISAAMIGGAFLPAFAGLLSGYFGWEIIPFVFFIDGVLLFVLYLISSGSRIN